MGDPFSHYDIYIRIYPKVNKFKKNHIETNPIRRKDFNKMTNLVLN